MNRKYSIEVHPEARPWVPDSWTLERLESEFPFPWVTIRIWPRRMVGQITGKVGLQPWQFRARSIGNVADIFVDPTETQKSIAWLIAHELGHHELKTMPDVKRTMNRVTPNLPRSGDAFHDHDTEETYCDGRATKIIGERLDREWWRDRTERARRSG